MGSCHIALAHSDKARGGRIIIAESHTAKTWFKAADGARGAVRGGGIAIVAGHGAKTWFKAADRARRAEEQLFQCIDTAEKQHSAEWQCRGAKELRSTARLWGPASSYL